MVDDKKPRAFVLMPYGEKEGAMSHSNPGETSTRNFEHVWDHLLVPLLGENFELERADKILKPGSIDSQYINAIYDADVVIADLTFGNPNVYYELGIRHALKKGGTVLIVHENAELPFDLKGQRIFKYGDALPSVRRFEKQLLVAVRHALEKEDDSPVHDALSGLFVERYLESESPDAQIEQLREELEKLKIEVENQQEKLYEYEEGGLLKDEIEEADTTRQILSLHYRVKKQKQVPISVLFKLGRRLLNKNKANEAISVLLRALEAAPENASILGRLGFAYRKKGSDYYAEAEGYFEKSLKINGEDLEVLGTYAGMLKRQEKYAEAEKLYEKAHSLDQEDLYPIMALGGISAILGRKGKMNDYYQKSVSICQRVIDSGDDIDTWTFLSKGESMMALGDISGAKVAFKEAMSYSPEESDVESVSDALSLLREQDVFSETVLKEILAEPIFSSIKE